MSLGTLAWCLLAVAAIVWTSAGFSLAGLSVSSPTWLLIVSLGLACVAVIARGSIPGLLRDLHTTQLPYTCTFAFALAALTIVLTARGVTVVGGADSAGYLAQAERWTQGSLRRPLPLPDLPVPEPAWAQSPLGFRPDPSHTATVPTYPPGLPLLQAAALRAGGEMAAVRAIPLLAALCALIALFLLARHHVAPAGAAIAVVTFGTTPIFLFQAMQPMSDVVSLGAWLLAMATATRGTRASALATGPLVAMATLVRPNLAPLMVPVLILTQTGPLLASRAPGAPDMSHVRGVRVLRLRPFAAMAVLAGSILAIAIVSGLQWTLYGSPTQSGYGTASELFSLAHVGPNVSRYAAWARESIGIPALWLLALGVPALAWRGMRDAAALALSAAVLITVGLHLVYIPFDNWTYLRFLLIALALLSVAGAGLLADATESLPTALAVPVAGALVLLVLTTNLHQVHTLGVFDLREREARYGLAGRFIRDQTSPRTVILAMQHSSSAPFYSGRSSVRIDGLDAAALTQIIDWARAGRRPLAYVLDLDEAEALRRRLPDHEAASLDWPPRAEIGAPIATRVWLDEDRESYRLGAMVSTARLLPPKR